MARGARRSWLVVPASKAGAVQAAATAGADVVVLDLTEFVLERDKPAARNAVRDALATVAAARAEAFVQIDPLALAADLSAAVWPGLAGLVVSRTESAAQLVEIDKSLILLEQERGLPAGSVQLVAALETARGNQDAHDILTATKRLCGATLGRADLVMDLRPEPSGEFHLMPYLMQRLVIVAGAVGVTPIGAWWRAPDRGLLATAANTLAAAERGRAIGFRGAMCLTAEQVAPLNRAYG